MPIHRGILTRLKGHVLPLVAALACGSAGGIAVLSLLASGQSVFEQAAIHTWQDRIAASSTIAKGVQKRLRLYDKAHVAGRITAARNTLQQTRRGLVRMLQRAPAQANQWILLAEVETRLAGLTPRAKRYLALARLTGRLEFPVVEKRIALGIRVWPLLDKAAQTHVRDDIRTLLRAQPNHRAIGFLAEIARAYSKYQADIVRSVIQKWAPTRIKTFDHWVRNGSPFRVQLQG